MRNSIRCHPETRLVGTLLVLLLAGRIAAAQTAGDWQIAQPQGSDVIEVSASKGGRHTLEIDDSFGFRTPVVKKIFNGSKLQLHGLALGLISGLDYHARLDGGLEAKDFRLQLSTFTEPEASCANLRRTWEEIGRKAAGDSHSRLGWDAAKGDWVVLQHLPLIGQGLYYVEYYLRPELHAARACNDLQTLDEVARYFLAMLQFTEPLGTLLSNPQVLSATKERMATADPSARVIPAEIAGKPADGELYMSQWLHPAAELLRLISLLPPARRTPAMQAFAGQYTRFIVVDQLDRYLVQQSLAAPGGGQAKGRIELWKLDLSGLPGDSPWANKVSDIDVWLIASAAEVLGANANDPSVAPLDAHQLEMLHRAIDTGIRFFESRRNDYPDTKNFQGQRVGSVTYGNGDYTAHSDFGYSGVTSEKFPSPAEKVLKADAGWDIAHAYRIPVFMRAMYENRKATGADWPQLREVQLLANQYVYQVFNGDFSRPLFHTHLDGSDGWHRVDTGADFGYPPSPYCDQHNPRRPCLSPASIMGWGLLDFASPDLAKVEDAMVKLALDPNPQARQFRNRYYLCEEPFEMAGPPGKQIYGRALYFVIGDNAEMIAPRSTENHP